MNTDESAKSESREETFKPTNDQEFLLKTLKELCDHLCSSLVRHNYKGKTITLKIKKDTFQVNVKSKTISNYVNDVSDSNVISDLNLKSNLRFSSLTPYSKLAKNFC